jgi:hypothetical protein
MGKIFNIVTSTIALVTHFAGNPVAHQRNRLIHRLILTNLARVPRQIRLSNLRHIEGHCFAADIDDVLIDDLFSSSTIILFENGKSLTRPHTRDRKEIAAKGQGATFHSGRTIYFSSSDNTSPLLNGRNYFAVHNLATPARFVQNLDWQKSTKKIGAANFLEMLSILCPGHFGFDRISGEGPGADLQGLRGAIDRNAELRIAADAMHVMPIPGHPSAWEFDIQNLRSIEAPEFCWRIRGHLHLGHAVPALFPFLELEGPGGFTARLEYGADDLFRLRAAKLRSVGQAMRDWFQNETGFDNWVAGICRLTRAPLAEGGFGLPEGPLALRDVLSESGLDDQYEFTLERVGSERIAKLGRIASWK